MLPKTAYKKQLSCSALHPGMCALSQLACNEEIELWHVKQSWVELYCSHCGYES